MIHLLDVNVLIVLIALIDRFHTAHEPATQWFADHAATGWATCPLTENAVLRIVGSPSYYNSPGSPAVVAPSLAQLITRPAHAFWPDDFSLLAEPLITPDRLASAGRLTDTYLLALAARRGGRLATFDRRLNTDAVRDGERFLRIIG